MFPDLYLELKAWQTAIAALFGFGGLIAAVLFSAGKQRERDDRIRDQETRAMARALRSEITSITTFLTLTKDEIRKIRIKGTPYLIPRPDNLAVMELSMVSP